MQRTISVKITTGQPLVPGITDEEALFVQLCEYLFDSGFLFDDASNHEVKKGQEIIQGFFEQEEDLINSLVSQDKFDKFTNYINDHKWSGIEKLQKIRIKIVKIFDQLTYGTHHSFNIRRNVHIGLLQFYQHPLHDFLIYLKAYYSLFEEEDEPEPNQDFSIADLMTLRTELIERVEGKKFVDLLLNGISKQRGGDLPDEVNKVRALQSSIPIHFIRPSQQLFQSSVAGQDGLPSGTPSQLQQRAPASASKNPTIIDEEQQSGLPSNKKSSKTIDKTLTIDEDEMDDLSFEEEATTDDESDVIYGFGRVTQDSSMQFIQKNPESAIKFLFRSDVTGKALPAAITNIYEEWEARGLKRRFIRNYILEIMEWEKFPTDLAIIEMASELKDRIYDLVNEDKL